MNLSQKISHITAKLQARQVQRKQLRGPADLQYAIADSIHLLDAQAWRALTADAGFFMSLDYLAALEPVMPLNLQPRYALVYGQSADGAGRQAVAAIYMQLAEIGLEQVRPVKPDGEGKKWLAPLQKLGAQARQRVLSCGNFLCYGQHGIALAPQVDAPLAWHGVAEALYRVHQADRLRGDTHFVLIKDLHGPWIEAAQVLSRLSYRYVETEPNMVLTLAADWRNYDDYLASLTAKYRANVRNQIFKPLDAAGCVVEHLSDVAAVQERIFELYKAVQVNAAVRPFELRPGYFAALQGVAGARFLCSVLRRDGQILGFLISLADGDTGIAYHVGFDREAAAELPIYLRLLRASIADCLALGCKRISFGRTALEPKAVLGAKPETYGVLLRHRQPVLNTLIKRLLLGIEHDDAPERNPFKQSAKA